MARLEYTVTDVTAQGHEPATRILLNGSVDPDTLDVFEEVMDKMIEAGRYRIIFDLSKLKYINSTGMGMSVQFADQLAEEKGGLVFMKVPPKVLLVIEMLGLQELFQIVSTQEQALAALAGGDVGPASIEVKLEDEAPAAISIEPVTVEAEPESPEEAFGDQGSGGGERRVIVCPSCSAQLSLSASGTYRCPRCRSVVEVRDDGTLQAYPETAGHVAELTLPADEDYLAGAGWMVNMAARKAGLGEGDANAVAQSAEGCLRLLASTALNATAERDRLHLFVRAESGRLSVRIYCAGQALESGEAINPYRDGMDRVEYIVSADGNLITMEKSA